MHNSAKMDKQRSDRFMNLPPHQRRREQDTPLRRHSTQLGPTQPAPPG
jgi:hypothetical protein